MTSLYSINGNRPMTDNDCCAKENQGKQTGPTPLCPSCGKKGRVVMPITIESLVTRAAQDRLAGLSGFRFCAEPECEVAYYNLATGKQIASDEVRVTIGQKVREPERTICYCFEHTAAEIEAEVVASGSPEVLNSIVANCKQGLDRCKETNPQGACCLGNVRHVMKNARAKNDTQAARGGVHKAGLLASGGAVAAAVLSSACCWLPLLLIAFGASAAGVASFFEAYRPHLLGATAVLLASGYYLVYFRKKKCAPGEACAVPNKNLVRFNKGMLWIASALVLTFSLFPNYVGVLIGGHEGLSATLVSSANERTFRIDGMTCEACAAILRTELSALSGVVHVDVSYDSKTAKVLSDSGGAEPANERIEATIKAAGYQGTLVPATGAKSPAPRFDTMWADGACCSEE
jgi:copper chaperone CopZ